MTKIKEEFIKSLSNYIREHALPNGYFQYSVTILQTEEGKKFSYFREKLIKINEKVAHEGFSND